MWKISVLFGILLSLLGLGGYILSGAASGTALIPLAFGLPLIIAGIIAKKESLRKHAMHAAATVALLGAIGGLVRPIMQLVKGEAIPMNAATFSQVSLAVLCIVFVVLCARSFVQARKAQAAA